MAAGQLDLRVDANSDRCHEALRPLEVPRPIVYSRAATDIFFNISPSPMPAIYGRNCVIAEDARIGTNTRIGNFVLIRDNTTIGKDCTVGSYVDIEGDVRIGDFVSLQSGCYLTRGVIIEDEVFCGPRVVTMNDKPITYRRPSLAFTRQAPRLLRAARVGGGAVLCPGVTIGENALIGAGSVVIHDVPDRCVAIGNPARIVGAVSADQII